MPYILNGKSQTFQNPLIKEYTLNHIRDPTIIGAAHYWGPGELRFDFKKKPEALAHENWKGSCLAERFECAAESIFVESMKVRVKGLLEY